MMKSVPIILSSFLLVMANISIAQDYEACALTRDEAFQNLSAQMRITINNEVTTEASEKKWGWFTLATQDNRVKQSVSSNIDIIGARIESKNGLQCVYLTEVNMIQNAKQHIVDVINSGKKLSESKSYEIRKHHAEEIIEQVRTGGSLVVIAKYNEKLSSSEFEHYDQTINAAQKLLTQGAVRFTGNLPSELSFDGIPLSYGNSLAVAPGEYTYSASFNNACNLSKSIFITQGEELVVTLEKLSLPQVSFTSPDIDSNSVRLTFNGKRTKISEITRLNEYQLDKNCEGRFSWQAEVGSQQDSGSISLSGGDEEVVILDFLSSDTIRNIKNLSASWRDGSVIELAGSYWMPSHKNASETDEEIGHKFANIQLTSLTLSGALAYGPTLDYSKFNKTESYHLGYQIRIQMTETGAESTPFNLFQLPIIPFIYGQVSVGFMEYENEDEEGTYLRTEQHEWKNYVMSSVGIGLSWVLSKDFSLVTKGQKNFSLDDGGVFYLGASVRY